MFRKLGLGAAGAVLMASSAYAGCGVTTGSVRILSNDFPALHAVADWAEKCIDGDMEFIKNQTTEHRDIQVAALTANPAQYTTAVVANSSIVPLMNEGLIRPLDDLIAKHGQNINRNQMITIDGKVMAIAFMANAQHLFYRKDILEAAGVDVPTTYEEVLDAAQKIRDMGLLDTPYAMNSMVGWNLGEEFVNMYLGFGGEFFEPGSASVSINNETGIAALNMIKALNDYANPDFLTFDSNATQAEWEAGNLALATMWGSRGGGILDDDGATADLVANTVLTGAPTVGGGTTPASTLWWDGFTIAQNISDEDAEATFVAMVNGISADMVRENNDKAVWLIDGYQPGPAAAGIAMTASSGTKPYPMLPFMGILHSALGNELAGFLQGTESAEQALADAEAAYTAAAREQGFVN
jgi:ABC-type glycerol-3-phosphate transport system substrate-binding protein